MSTETKRKSPRAALRKPDAAPLKNKSDWRPFSTAPKTGHFLVFLESEMLSARIHTMSQNPKVGFIGGRLAFDAPKPTHWMPFPPNPVE